MGTRLNNTLEQLKLLIKARFPVIYIVSYEEERVTNYLKDVLLQIQQKEREPKQLARWSPGDAQILWEQIPYREGIQGSINMTAPDAALKYAISNDRQLDNAVFVYYDMHRTLAQRFDLVRLVRSIAKKFRADYSNIGNVKKYRTLIFIAPDLEIARELEKDVTVIDFPLPEEDEFAKILDDHPATQAIEQSQEKMEFLEKLCKAGLGLTRDEFVSAINMFYIPEQKLVSDNVQQMIQVKAQVIRKSGMLEFWDVPKIRLGGLKGIEEWAAERRIGFTREARDFGCPAPKGVFLFGVSGGGKSQLAKLIASRFEFPLLRLDIGSLFGKFVGEAEKNTRMALKLADALAPVVLWLDEIDKGFAGMGAAAGAGGDGGVAHRVFGAFLTWMAEKQSPVFVIATANHIERLPEELRRRGRVDQVFFAGLPNQEGCTEILKIYLEYHFNNRQLYRDNFMGQITDKSEFENLCSELASHCVAQRMTGAEIEQAVYDAAFKAVAAKGEQRKKIDPRLLRGAITDINPLYQNVAMDDLLRDAPEALDCATGRKVQRN